MLWFAEGKVKIYFGLRSSSSSGLNFFLEQELTLAMFRPEPEPEPEPSFLGTN